MENVNRAIWNGERLETNVYNDNTVEHLHRYAIAMELTQGKDVLDVASGEGYGSKLISSVANSVIGVDISEEVIRYACEKYQAKNLKFLQGSADKIPVESNSIDVVVSFETIEHHDKHEEMMAEIKRVLKPNGLLVMSSPDKLNYSDIPETENSYHVKELYIEEFRALCKKYFKNHVMFLQRMVYGSLVSPDNNAMNFKEYVGNHYSINKFQSVQNSVYNICIASDSELDHFEVSFFDGKKALDELLSCTSAQVERQVMQSVEIQMKQSISYKIGYFVTHPLRLLRNIKQVFNY